MADREPASASGQDGASLRVLHIGKYFPPHRGGMETYLQDLVSAQTRAGCSIRVLVHSSERCLRTRSDPCSPTTAQRSDPQRAHNASELNIAAPPAGTEIIRAGRWFTLMFTPIAPLFAGVLRRLLRDWQPSVVHVHLPNPSAFWLLLPGLLPRSTRLILHWHSDVLTAEASPAIRRFYRGYRPLEQRLLARADRVIATSPDYAASSAALATVAAKTRVVPLALDRTRLFKPDLQVTAGQAANQTARPQLLSVGRLTHYKGFSVLLQALHRLPDFNLTLVGDGEQRATLVAEAAALKIDERVRFVGSVSDQQLGELYAAADMFVLASTDRTEAFGMVLLEAMHYGLPIVATDIAGSGVPWVAKRAAAFALAAPGDAAALASSIERLFDDIGRTQKSHAFGDEPAHSYPREFDLTTTTAAILDLYREPGGR